MAGDNVTALPTSNPWGLNLDAIMQVSMDFMLKDLAKSGINWALIPANARPTPLAPTLEYPNGRYSFPYPFSNGLMSRIKNNLDGSTLPSEGDGRTQQRYEQPSSEQVGTWANAPYLIAPPQSGTMYIAEGPKKALSLFVNGCNVIGLAGAFNYMNGNAHAQPRALNSHIITYIKQWVEQCGGTELCIVPDPDAFYRPDIGRPYWRMIQLILGMFPRLHLTVYVLPDKVDDLIGLYGYAAAWAMGEHQEPLKALCVPLIDIAKNPVFSKPLLVTHVMKKDKDCSYVAIQEVNAAELLASHPRAAGRIAFDLSRGTASFDGKIITEMPAFTQEIARLLAHDLGFQHNGQVLSSLNLRSAMAGLIQRCGYYPMQQLVAVLPKWDGIKRLDDLGVKYCGFPDNEWSRLWMRSFVMFTMRRGLDPGCDCRLLWLLQGAQRVGKSRLPSTLFGRGMSSIIKHSDIKKEDEFIRRLYQAGHVAIIDDLDAFERKWQAALKGLVSAGTKDMPEQIRFLYLGEVSRLRHFTLFATANHLDVLNDDLSGNTRYLAMQSTNVKNQVFDYAAIEADRDQILAEAYAGVQTVNWIEFEETLAAVAEDNSTWATQEGEQFIAYRLALETILKAAVDRPVHMNDARFVVHGIYHDEPVYALRTSYLKEYIHHMNPRTYVGDVPSWLRAQGWQFSETRTVCGRRKVYWMPVVQAKELYTID